MKRYNIIFFSIFILFAGILIASITSCGKEGAASPTGLNIQYEVLNLSPDLGAIDLYIDFRQVNGLTSPYIFSVNPGYFYVTSTDTPYQFRPYVPNATTGTTLFSRGDILKSGLKYSLFISGSSVNNSLVQTFTVDADTIPTIGRGKIRFVNVSPTATGGLDVYANGTEAFKAVPYQYVSKYIEVPVGNYDLQINATGQTSILKELPGVTIQDGRLYTLYTYGYTNRADSAAFNAGMITNW
jgi:hypothetical protein